MPLPSPRALAAVFLGPILRRGPREAGSCPRSNPRKGFPNVTRSGLVARLALRFPHLTAQDNEFAVRLILDAIGDALAEGSRVEVRGFGSFALSHRPSRIGRNPKSGERVVVPARHIPHFKAGKELRERVDVANARREAQPRAETRTPSPSSATEATR